VHIRQIEIEAFKAWWPVHTPERLLSTVTIATYNFMTFPTVKLIFEPKPIYLYANVFTIGSQSKHTFKISFEGNTQ
jgi:hypothetical protein